MRTVMIVAVLLVACGGGSKSAEGPKTASKEEKSDTPVKSEKTAEAAPKKTFKYPEPWLEPECATPQPEGYLPAAKKAVAEVRKKHWSDLEKCAEAAPAGENVSGEIRTSFRLDPDGVPRCVEAPGAPGGAMEDVVRCVVSVYRTFRFPKPKNGSIRVTDGIHLHVSHDEEEE